MKIRILVVDDNEKWRHFAAAVLLAHDDFQIVGHAIGGLEAVQQAQRLQPHLILLDIGLPELNGIEAARRIQQVSRNSKILFVSTEKNPEIVTAALQTGAHGYLNKSDAGSELFGAISAILEGKRFVSSSVTLGAGGLES